MGLARRIEQRAVSYQDFWGSDSSGDPNHFWSFGAARTHSKITVTQERALRATAVLACVGLISDTVATLPFEVFRRNSLGIKVAVDLPNLLDQPHPEMTRFEWVQRVMVSLLLDGNAYIYVARGESGSVVSLTPIHPYRVHPERDHTGEITFVVDGIRPGVGSRDMLHIKGFVKPGDLRGLSPIEAAKEAVGLTLAAEQYGARFFGDGAQPSGVLKTPQDLSDNAATVMAKQFQEKHGGMRNAHMPLVLTGGAEWQALMVPPDQAQFLETRKYQASEIARLYRVPLHLIAEVDRTTSWGSGIEQQNISFVQYTLMPWLVRIEQALTQLMPGRQTVKFNADEFLRATMLERYQAYAVALTNGILNKDEVRSIEDMPPLPDGTGQVHLQPLNLGPAGNPDASGDAVGKATKQLLSLINVPTDSPDAQSTEDGGSVPGDPNR